MNNTDKTPQPVTQDALTPCLTRSVISYLIHEVSDEKVEADFQPLIQRLAESDTESTTKENVEKNKQIQKDYFDLLFRYATETLKGSPVNAHAIDKNWMDIFGSSITTLSRMRADPSFQCIFGSVDQYELETGKASGISSLHLKTVLFVWVLLCWTAAYNSLHHLGIDAKNVRTKENEQAVQLNISSLQSTLSAGVKIWCEMAMEITKDKMSDNK